MSLTVYYSVIQSAAKDLLPLALQRREILRNTRNDKLELSQRCDVVIH